MFSIRTFPVLFLTWVYALVSSLSSHAQSALAETNAGAAEKAIVAELAEKAGDEVIDGGILFWSDEQRRIGFKNLEHIYPTRRVHAASTPYPLGKRNQDLSSISYRLDGQEYLLSDFLDHPSSIGLIVVQNGDVITEYYAQGNDSKSVWMSFSVTKSVTSMLIGAAIADGFIESVDDKVVDYLPRLRGSSYENATIANVLHMASGVRWDEDYTNPRSDVARGGGLNGIELVRFLSKLPREHTPGEVFNYSTGETNLVGEILRSAIGNNASTYLEAKIWSAFGMESDAVWALGTPMGAELGGCCISATLRDFARIGLFALNDGVLSSGERVLPKGWMTRSTTPSPAEEGYGYLWWLYSEESFAARGIFGQQIRINPSQKLVIAVHSNAPTAVGSTYHGHVDAAIAAVESHFSQ
ncbi:MAG: serine hydrolase [Pseudomonadota bacterium]